MNEISKAREKIIEALYLRASNEMLLGNILISEDEKRVLQDYASGKIKIAAACNSYVSKRDSLLVSLSIAISLRDWQSEIGDSDMYGKTFWEYVYTYFSVSFTENYGNLHSYKVFKEAIRVNRIFAHSGQKYYTTSLAHALSPKKDFFNLFEQIFAFYQKTLNWQYEKGDEIFEIFSYAMKEKFEGKKSDDVYIKALQSSSAVKLIFSEYTEMAGQLVENVARIIDILVAGQSMGVGNYLEQMLNEWWNRRSREEHVRLRLERSKSEHVVTDFKNIRPRYELEKSTVKIVVPPIRLGKDSGGIPIARIYVRDDAIAEAKMRWVKDEFGIFTALKTQIVLNELAYEQQSFEPRLVITYGEADIYDSENSLFRNAICFDRLGAEVTHRPEDSYVTLITTSDAGVDIGADEYTQEDGYGQCYRVFFDKNTRISVNDELVLSSAVSAGKFELSLLTPEVLHVKQLIGGEEYALFKSSPEIRVRFPDDANPKQYQIKINGVPQAFDEYEKEADYFIRQLPKGIAVLKIIDISTHKVLYELKYSCIEDFSVSFDGYYSCGNEISRELTIRLGNETEIHTVHYSDSFNTVILFGRDYSFEVELPVFRAVIDGEDISLGEKYFVWHKDIRRDSKLQIVTPWGFESRLFINEKPIEQKTFDLGNYVQLNSASQSHALFWASVKDQSERQCLFELTFQPRFTESPLLLQDEALLWNPCGIFVGDKDCQFTATLMQAEEVKKRLDRLSMNPDKFAWDLPDGKYVFEVSVVEQGFFGDTSKLVYNGSFALGNPNAYMFDDRAVIITAVILDNEKENFALNKKSGVITDLRFVSDEKYLTYIGKLQFFNKQKGEYYAYSFKDKIAGEKEILKVNPVKLQLINDERLAMTTDEDYLLNVDRKFSSITHYEQADEERGRYIITRYYSYEVIDKTEIANLPDSIRSDKPRYSPEYIAIREAVRRDMQNKVAVGRTASDLKQTIFKSELHDSKVDLNMPIEKLSLSARSYTSLSRARYATVGDISQRTYSELLKTRNLGAKCLKEVINELAKHGITIKEE